MDDWLRHLLENATWLAEFLDKHKKSEPESNQYKHKRINKQLDRLIALMSENE